jgi:hypothetical protein
LLTMSIVMTAIIRYLCGSKLGQKKNLTTG